VKKTNVLIKLKQLNENTGAEILGGVWWQKSLEGKQLSLNLGSCPKLP